MTTSVSELAAEILMAMYTDLAAWNYAYELHATSSDPTDPVQIVIKSPSQPKFFIEVRVEDGGELTLSKLYNDMGVKLSVPSPRVTSAGLSSRVHSLMTQRGA